MDVGVAADRGTWEGRAVSMRLVRHLPEADRLGFVRDLWDRLGSEASRLALLLVLVDEVPGAEATAYLAELYPHVPADEGLLRGRALARFGYTLHEPAMPYLGEALRDSDPDVREAARKAFQAFKEQREALEEFEAWTRNGGDQRAIAAELVLLLDDPHREVVLGAVRGLGAIRAHSALPDLVRLLAREDEALQAAVNEAIARMAD